MPGFRWSPWRIGSAGVNQTAVHLGAHLFAQTRQTDLPAILECRMGSDNSLVGRSFSRFAPPDDISRGFGYIHKTLGPRGRCWNRHGWLAPRVAGATGGWRHHVASFQQFAYIEILAATADLPGRNFLAPQTKHRHVTKTTGLRGVSNVGR